MRNLLTIKLLAFPTIKDQKMRILTFLFCIIAVINSFSAHSQCVVSNEVKTPPFNITAQNSRFLLIHMSNTSDSSITVSMEQYENTGATFPNSSADIIFGLSGFPAQAPVVMPARSSGYVLLKGNGFHRIGFAKIKWESENCLEKPMTAMMELQQSGDKAIGHMAVNGGLAF